MLIVIKLTTPYIIQYSNNKLSVRNTPLATGFHLPHKGLDYG